MHPLVQKLTKQFPAIPTSHPVLVALLELGAAAEPREKDRPVRRKIQMRMLRQWERLEVAVVDFMDAKATDDDLCTLDDSILEPFYLENSGWVVPGVEPEELRNEIYGLLRRAADNKLKADTIMKAPLLLEDQFNTVVTSSESAGGMLDKFLRGSLRTSQACANLVLQIEEHLADGGDFPSREPLEEVKAALLAQGFTH